MDKNKKSADNQNKSGTAAHSDKQNAKHDTSSKKMMDESGAKSEKAMHASPGKSAMGDKNIKRK